MQPHWHVVVPVKGGPDGKSRLGAGPELALAMAADCVAACLRATAVRTVQVVAGSPRVPQVLGAGALTGAGGDPARLRVILQPGGTGGLAGAVQLGLDACAGPSAVLLADLPALQPADLDAALAALAGPRAGFVPDRQGTGTVLLAGPSPRLQHRFGPGSAAAHASAGVARREVAAPRLRTDVDTPADLLTALDLGVGVRTRARVGAVQATVLSYDPLTHAGEVVLDDGTAVPLDEDALVGSGLRHLRAGQRVTCALGPDRERVLAVRILGIGDPLPD